MINVGLNTLQAYPALRIYRGYDPLNPRGLSAEYPVLAADVATIKEGMIMFPKWNSATAQTEWVISAAGIDQPDPHIALTDANRYDVVQSNRLVGLPCSGDFVLHTPHYDHGVADAIYVQNATLTYNNAGSLTPTDHATTSPVVAVMQCHLPFDVSSVDNSFKKDGTLAAAQYTDAKVKQVIKVKTCFRAPGRDNIP